jgi:hypothetical protein
VGSKSVGGGREVSPGAAPRTGHRHHVILCPASFVAAGVKARPNSVPNTNSIRAGLHKLGERLRWPTVRGAGWGGLENKKREKGRNRRSVAARSHRRSAAAFDSVRRPHDGT